MGVPVLGICYGQQAMCAQLGGAVAASDHREFGRAFIDITDDCALFAGLWSKGSREQVWMSHGDRVEALPPGFRVVAQSEGAPFAVVADDERRFYGIMFHPEVVHTPQGGGAAQELHPSGRGLPRRLDHGRLPGRGDGAHPRSRWAGAASSAGFRAGSIHRWRRCCSTRRSATSSPASSSITACCAPARREEVVTLFRDHYNIPLIHRDASGVFLAKLAGVVDPEQKRKTIGALFIDVFDEEAQKLGGADFLAQGTLYPDVIESVSFDRRAQRHHQVAP